MANESTMLFIWVRATTDWSHEAACYAQLRPEFVGMAALWNSTFTMPYHLFRHRVRLIAQRNHADVAGAVCARWEEIPDGALVVPVDDDWFAPNLGEALAAARRPDAIGCFWMRSFLEVTISPVAEIGTWIRKLFSNRPPKWLCSTNNYALVKGALGKEPATKRLCRSHTEASVWFEEHRGPLVSALDRRLSLMNRTLASQTSLGHRRARISRTELLLKFFRYRLLYAQPLPPELSWADPYCKQMDALMGELQTRRA